MLSSPLIFVTFFFLYFFCTQFRSVLIVVGFNQQIDVHRVFIATYMLYRYIIDIPFHNLFQSNFFFFSFCSSSVFDLKHLNLLLLVHISQNPFYSFYIFFSYVLFNFQNKKLEWRRIKLTDSGLLDNKSNYGRWSKKKKTITTKKEKID